MTPLQCVPIIGSDKGIQTNVKPYLIPDKAFQELQNAYVYRDRLVKRENLKLLGRLRRVLTAQALGNTDGAGAFSGNIFNILGLESTASLEGGSIVVTIGATMLIETSAGSGILAGGLATGTINYATGAITIVGAPALTAITIDFNYFPGLPVVGIYQREVPALNEESTIFFDTTYAYIWASGFQQLGTATWNGLDSDLFWCTNFRGVEAFDRVFFATNFNNTGVTPDPIRYTTGATWVDFSPLVSATVTLWQARIIVPYYGRLLMFNTWEGDTGAGQAAAQNYFARCRFSQIGNPFESVAAAPVVDLAWRSDIFGRGGFIDAPTNEEIVSVGFIKNTLIVYFERSTWQLRYVGEYGLPFLWERISSDFGSESTCSVIRFDPALLALGDKAITKANAISVDRNDLQIPDFIFQVRNENSGTKRVVGVRNFQKELVFWCFSNAKFGRTFPNSVAVYNYRNNTYAFFRDNVTFFGTFQLSTGTLWGDFDVYWNDFDTFWGNQDTQTQFPAIVSGNQQGYIHFYAASTSTENAEMLSIKSITLSDPVNLEITNHNLESDELIYITGVTYTLGTDLNDTIFRVKRIDDDNVTLQLWDSVQEDYFDFASGSSGTYMGNGQVALLPIMFAQTKDFNPYLEKGLQMKMSYLDFLVDTTYTSYTVELYANSHTNTQANLIVGNKESSTDPLAPFYTPGTTYGWQRFYATVSAQFVSVAFTYDGILANDIDTHRSGWELNSVNLWVRPGSKNVF